MSTAIAISLLALLISVLSAVYTRRSASHAKDANRIALHDRKIEVLTAFRRFQSALAAGGENFHEADLLPLLTAQDQAKLYFGPAVVAELRNYAHAAYELLIARDRAKSLVSAARDVPSAKWDEIFSKLDRCREMETTLLASLEAEVQLADVGVDRA
jgi:hypothetical protein